MELPNWMDPSLAVSSDDAWAEKYHRLQSWCREQRTARAPRRSEQGDAVGSMLHNDAVPLPPGLGFVDSAVAPYATNFARCPREPALVPCQRRDMEVVLERRPV